MKPKTVDEWKEFDEEQKIIIKNYLFQWLQHFKQQANGQQGSVYRADFISNDPRAIFYFTNCNDLVDDEGNSDIGQQNRRKTKVMLQLLIKTLMGEKLGKKLKCGHCGFDDCIIDVHHYGSFTVCPKCKMCKINIELFNLEKINETIADISKRIDEFWKVGLTNL